MNSAFTNPITPRASESFYESPPAPEIFFSAELILTYECAAGRCGPGVTITVPAGRFFAASQVEADAAALVFADGQGAAWRGDCGWPSDSFDQDFDCSAGYSGETVHIHYDAGEFCAANTGVANSLALAAAELAAQEQLVCTPIPGPEPILEIILFGLSDYNRLYETTRLNDSNTVWVGETVPPSGTPAYWYRTDALDDTKHPPVDAHWWHYTGGTPENISSWTPVTVGVPAQPLLAEFTDQVLWAFKPPLLPPPPLPYPLYPLPGHDPLPFEGPGDFQVMTTARAHRVGVGYFSGFESGYNPKQFGVMLHNAGSAPLIFGTPTFEITRKDVSWGWEGQVDFDLALQLSFLSGVTLDPGEDYPIQVNGPDHNITGPDLSEAMLTLSIPTNLSAEHGGPVTKIDFAFSTTFDG